MALRTVLLLACCLLAVNSFTVQSKDERFRSSSYPLTGYDMRSRDNGFDDQRHFEHSQMQGDSSYPNRGKYDERRPSEGSRQQLNVKYPASSSSSSSQESNESHEVKKIEKQYHDTNGYNNDNSHSEPGHTQSRNYKMNFEMSDLQNAIEKSM